MIELRYLDVPVQHREPIAELADTLEIWTEQLPILGCCSGGEAASNRFEVEGVEQPLVIAADRDRLRELINNLIDNAIRYSQANGRVTVRTARTPDGQCKLAISDDGLAIPVAEIIRIVVTELLAYRRTRQEADESALPPQPTGSGLESRSEGEEVT